MLIKSLLVGLLLSPLAAAQGTLPPAPVSEAPIIDYQNRYLQLIDYIFHNSLNVFPNFGFVF